jgi:hypothetical protein
MPLLLNSYILSGLVSGNHKYDLCSDDNWMLNKPRKSFMQPVKLCLPQLEMSHTTVYQAVKLSWQLKEAGWSLCVDLVYVVSEAEILVFGGF